MQNCQPELSGRAFASAKRLAVCLLALISLLALPLGGGLRAQQDAVKPSTIVVPIEGRVDIQTVALVRRAIAVAKSEGASRILLEVDTTGARVEERDELTSMLSLLADTEGLETVAFVKQALATGAVVALACDRIFITEQATIGAAEPIGRNFIGFETVADRATVDAFREDVRAVAQKKHGDEVALLAAAMVDPTIQLVEARVRGPDGVARRVVLTIEDLEKRRQDKQTEVLSEEKFKLQPLVLNAAEALRTRVAEAVVLNRDSAMTELGAVPDEAKLLESSWSEQLASFLYSIRMFILIAAVVLTVLAFQAPGTGVPEALAILAFALFFAGSWLTGLAAWTEILLFVGGIGLVLVELFLIPGTLIAGLAGLACVVAAIVLSLQSFGVPGSQLETDVFESNLRSLLFAVLIIIAFSLTLSRLLPRIPFFNKLLLADTRHDRVFENAATSEATTSPLLQRVGRAVTDLRPAGKIDVDGEHVDVVTEAGFVERGTPVRIIRVEGNRIVVEPSAEAGLVDIGWLIFLLFLGLIALVAEVFFPSFGILSIVSAVLTITSVFLAFQHGVGTGVAFLVAVAILVPIAIWWAFKTLPKTPIGKRLLVQPSGKREARDAGLEAMIGKTGTTETPLRPGGSVVIDGQRYDAMSRGERLDSGVAVRVIRIDIAQLVVAPAEGAPGHAGHAGGGAPGSPGSSSLGSSGGSSSGGGSSPDKGLSF